VPSTYQPPDDRRCDDPYDHDRRDYDGGDYDRGRKRRKRGFLDGLFDFD